MGDQYCSKNILLVYKHHYGRYHVGYFVINNEVHPSEGIILNVKINDLTTRKHIFINDSECVEFRSCRDNPPGWELRSFQFKNESYKNIYHYKTMKNDF